MVYGIMRSLMVGYAWLKWVTCAESYEQVREYLAVNEWNESNINQIELDSANLDIGNAF